MKRFASLAALALAAACALAQTGPTVLQQITTRLTANDLKADISFLASDALQGRGTPSPGLDIAGEYIAAQFRRAGLEPAGDEGYFQNAPYAQVTPNIEGMEFTLETASGAIKAQKAAIALMQPGAVDLTKTAIIKVLASDAAAFGALTPEQVRGKVLVLDFPDGANAGLINRQLPTITERLQPALIVMLRSGGQPTNTTARLREMSAAPSIPMMLVWDEAVRTALAAGKAGPVEAMATARIPAPISVPVKLRNVVGVLRGSDPALRETCVMVTGHYDHLGVRGTGDGDHINNGANDDASGTASVMAIANALAALPSRPKRSIVFIALFGEEVGGFGARYYSTHPVFPLSKTVADMNLEQLGRTDVDGGSSIGILNVTGFDYSTLTDFLRKSADVTGLQIVKDEKLNESYFPRSDNQAFANAGIPAHTLSVGYMFPDYHKVGDEWQKLDYDNLAKVDRTIAFAIHQMADSTEAPQWKEMPATQRYIQARQDTISKGR